MTRTPQPAPYRPETVILTLGDECSDRVEPARFPMTRLRFRNQRWAAAVGLSDLDEGAWLDHFAGFVPLPGSLPEPLALRYHGHQFRSYNPDLGDGRGFTFAQLRDGEGRLLDLGTKGSGQTPWSRFGDGRLTLKGGVREVLAAEMLEALGVETSQAFSLVETGESLHRGDEPSPTRSAVLVRLSHGHIRIGSFQRLAWLRDAETMRRLVDYVLVELHGDTPGDPVRLLANVVERTATLAASYMAAGFVHGVLNSDNINVTGESFDYGPWRFTPRWEPGFTAAYFDQTGLYAFGRQAEAIHWDVVQLAIALGLIAEIEPLGAVLDRFAAAYETAYVRAMLRRLGVRSRGEPADQALVAAVERVLARGETTIDRFFFDRRGGRRIGDAPDDPELGAAFAGYEPTARDHPYWAGTDPCALDIDTVEAIWAPIAEADDWSRFEAKIAEIRRMGAAMAD